MNINFCIPFTSFTKMPTKKNESYDKLKPFNFKALYEESFKFTKHRNLFITTLSDTINRATLEVLTIDEYRKSEYKNISTDLILDIGKYLHGLSSLNRLKIKNYLQNVSNSDSPDAQLLPKQYRYLLSDLKNMMASSRFYQPSYANFYAFDYDYVLNISVSFDKDRSIGALDRSITLSHIRNIVIETARNNTVMFSDLYLEKYDKKSSGSKSTVLSMISNSYNHQSTDISCQFDVYNSPLEPDFKPKHFDIILSNLKYIYDMSTNLKDKNYTTLNSVVPI